MQVVYVQAKLLNCASEVLTVRMYSACHNVKLSALGCTLEGGVLSIN